MPEKTEEISDTTKYLIEKAVKANLHTTWSRYELMQPQCGYGELGLCCRICTQGPCQINPFGDEPKRGICGATDYTIISRNLLRTIAGGCAAHSDHGRHIAHTLLEVTKGKAPAYKIKDTTKLEAVAKRIGVDTEGKKAEILAREVVVKAFEDFSRWEHIPCVWLTSSLTKKRLELLDFCDILPYSIDATICEIMHRTTMGVDADPVPLLFDGLKCALADLTGMHISTDLSDILFGTPKLVKTEANIGVLKKDFVNIACHGHNPILSEVICDVAEELKEEAISAGAKGINIVGICCTGNELLMRRGIPLAVSFGAQELAVTTGALDAFVVDYQCVMPSLGYLAQCYHTKLISTSALCRQIGDIHIEFKPENARQCAQQIIRLAIQAYKERKIEIDIPSEKNITYAGFSMEQIMEFLNKVSDKPFEWLASKLKDGTLFGIALMAGCNNIKFAYEQNHLTVVKELLKNNVLVLSTGCAAGAFGRNGFLSPDAKKYAGENLRSFLAEIEKNAGIELPPVWHMGSCVDNTRIHDFITALANHMNVDIKDLPVVASAPENMSEKAVAIGCWLVVTGWPVHVGSIPYIKGSKLVMQIAENTARDVYGGYFIFEANADIAARKLINIIKHRRWKLGIYEDTEIVYWTGETAKEMEVV
jgi:carbon-monoxide dehydrogenase catalytic subunit